MTELIVNGAAGRMGRMIDEAVEARPDAFHIAARADAKGGAGMFVDLKDYGGPAGVVLDFSNHAATRDLLDFCLDRGCPVVIATTGQTEAEMDAIRAASERIPVFYSANMSVGIAVLADLAKRAAAAFPRADIEIVEVHHNQKLDVPSGTALLLGRAIQEARPGATLLIGRHENGKRTAEEIGVHSLRLGNEVGIHEILISTGNETLTLRHQAVSRALFAEGALAAAAFLKDRPAGFYSMKDLLNEES